MSHKVTMKVQMEDRECLKKAAQELNLVYQEGKHGVQLYSQKVETDFSFQLPGWKYRCAVTDEGVAYDNYNGSWGKIGELHKFNQEYCKQVADQELTAAGMFLESTEVQENGEVWLTYNG